MSKTVAQVETDAVNAVGSAPLSPPKLDAQNIRKCQYYVRSMQRKLDKAVKDNDRRKIQWFTHLLTKRSKAVKILAINRVTKVNKGRYTPGVDGKRILKGHGQENVAHNKAVRMELLHTVDITLKPLPISRTFIKKSNGKMRPLGIPTLRDRVIQDIVRTALEPITEYHFSDNSYGFRPKRSCHDAIQGLFNKLARRIRGEWVIEGDIEGCFDNISHEHILRTLQEWKTPECIRKVVGRMLKAKILSAGFVSCETSASTGGLSTQITTSNFPENETLTDPETGTPQGGILSPMLANVALTTLDNFCEKNKKQSNPLVRYADDFVVTCSSEKEAVQYKVEIAGMLKETLGLTLSDEKTNVTNIHDGFNFLGFNFRKYRMKSPKHKNHTVGKLLITPQEEKVADHLWEVKQTLKQNKTARQDTIIRLLNPKLQGFALYYRFVVSQKTYDTIDSKVWYKLWRWALRRHPNKTRRWIRKKYFTTHGRKWRFKAEKGEETIIVSKIPIVRYVKVKSGMRVHGGDKETIEYWNKREYRNALSQIYSVKVEKLFRRQKGMCPYCGQPITKAAIEKGDIHMHHLIPRTPQAEGVGWGLQDGSEELKDLRLVHKECHTEAHSIMSREQMAYWWRNKGNYLRRANIEAFAQADMKIESISGVDKKISSYKKKVTADRKFDAKKKQAQAAKLRSEQMLREGRL